MSAGPAWRERSVPTRARAARVGDAPEPDDLRSALADAGDVGVVYLTHSETSTGVVCDVQSLAAVAKEAGALVVVDAVSVLGAVPLETDAPGASTSSSRDRRRHLMTPAGIAFASRRSCCARGRHHARRRRATSWTGSARERHRRSSDAAVHSRDPDRPAQNVACGLLLEEGLDAAFERPRKAWDALP